MSETKPGTIYEDGRLEQYLEKGIDGTASVALAIEETVVSDGGTSDDVYFADFDHIGHKRTMSVGDRLEEFVLELKLAESLGLDYYFTAEHHFSGDFSLSPSQAVTCTIAATQTERIRFGPMTIILPIADPLRIAEEFTIIDHLSGGRLELGVGRGVVHHELATYGRRGADGPALFRENLECILKCWTNEENFSWNGVYHQYYDIEMPWKPLQKPLSPHLGPDGDAGERQGVGSPRLRRGRVLMARDRHTQGDLRRLQRGLAGVRDAGRAAAHRLPVVLHRRRHRR